MSVEIQIYNEQYRNDWESFIEQKALNSTFLHSRKFYDHNPCNKLDDASLMFYKKNKLIALFPANLYADANCRILHSFLRATYGGFIVSREVSVKTALEIVGKTIEFAKTRQVSRLIVRNPFRIFNIEPCDEIDYAMWFHGFEIKSREIEICFKLDDGDIKTIRSRYSDSTRRNVKKAAKFIDVRISVDIENYWHLLEKNLAERHHKKPVHDYDSIIRLIESVGSENVLFFGGYHENELVSGILIFKFNNLALHAQYIASDSRFQDLRPVNAVVDYIAEWGNQRGFKYFNLGTANENDGKSINGGLFSFKEGFGGSGVLRETMILNL
ncbi:MAG TPA: GNAT family N-acetyltransferase [Pyrinomonadaceae bacterium]